jgi:hypothetical protein
MFQDRIRVEVMGRGSGWYGIRAGRLLMCKVLEGRLEQIILELNLPLSLESGTHVGVYVKANVNRANNCPLLRNIYSISLL